MGYADYMFYQSIYADIEISQADYNRLAWEASRKMDVATTGIDGVKKLKIAFPTDEEAAETIKRCFCKLVNILYRVELAERTVNQARGYEETENGLRGKVISSVSAGNESISYATTSGGTATLIDKALSDKAVQDRLYRDTIFEYLSGVHDKNGVNLLYMGRYPYNAK